MRASRDRSAAQCAARHLGYFRWLRAASAAARRRPRPQPPNRGPQSAAGGRQPPLPPPLYRAVVCEPRARQNSGLTQTNTTRRDAPEVLAPSLEFEGRRAHAHSSACVQNTAPPALGPSARHFLRALNFAPFRCPPRAVHKILVHKSAFVRIARARRAGAFVRALLCAPLQHCDAPGARAQPLKCNGYSMNDCARVL